MCCVQQISHACIIDLGGETNGASHKNRFNRTWAVKQNDRTV